MKFFAPAGKYPAVGMFSLTHIIALFLFLAIIALMVYVSRNVTNHGLLVITRTLAIVVTILEIIKISYNLYYGYTWLDAWLPLTFCSLFIYALWISGFAKGKIKTFSDSFIVGGCVICGLAFLIMPTTSFMTYPMLHYLPIYSMVYHSMMMYLGLIYLYKRVFIPNRSHYKYYTIFCGCGMLLAIVVNLIFNCNMMFLMEPYNIPVPFLKPLAENFLPAYTLLIASVYMIVPYSLIAVVDYLGHYKESSQTELME